MGGGWSAADLFVAFPISNAGTCDTALRLRNQLDLTLVQKVIIIIGAQLLILLQLLSRIVASATRRQNLGVHHRNGHNVVVIGCLLIF